MIYETYANHRMNQAYKVPFAGLTAPMGFVGEAVYMAVETATRMVGRAFGAAMVKARERATINQLADLDDRTLRDIGVSRSEILFLARKVAENPGVDYRTMCR